MCEDPKNEKKKGLKKTDVNDESIYNILKSLLAITKSFHRRLEKLEAKVK